MGDKQILLAVVVPLPAGPYEVVLTIELERGWVDSPFVARVADLSLEGPSTFDGIIVVVLNDVDAMRSIVPGIGSEVDVPFVAQAMQLGRP